MMFTSEKCLKFGSFPHAKLSHGFRTLYIIYTIATQVIFYGAFIVIFFLSFSELNPFSNYELFLYRKKDVKILQNKQYMGMKRHEDILLLLSTFSF